MSGGPYSGDGSGQACPLRSQTDRPRSSRRDCRHLVVDILLLPWRGRYYPGNFTIPCAPLHRGQPTTIYTTLSLINTFRSVAETPPCIHCWKPDCFLHVSQKIIRVCSICIILVVLKVQQMRASGDRCIHGRTAASKAVALMICSHSCEFC